VNDALLARAGLDDAEVDAGIERTREKVKRRVASMRHGLTALDVAGRRLVVVDDGLASGFTMRVAVEALTLGRPASIAVAVPTAHADAVEAMSAPVETVYCANVRSGWSFAVADAYVNWSDVSEEQATTLLRACRRIS
jgi:predicted phosphoribosyltransferase